MALPLREDIKNPMLPKIDEETWKEESKQEEDSSEDTQEKAASVKSAASKLVWTCIADIGVFFGVLLVGFAYVWKRGDLDWVRSTAGHAPPGTKADTPWQEASKSTAAPHA